MKYLVAVDKCFLDSPGGMARVAWDIAEEMQRHGHDVTMLSIASQPLGRPFSWEDHNGMRIFRIESTPQGRLSPPRFFQEMRQISKVVESELGKEPWDILHTHGIYSGLGTWKGLKGKVPFISTIHSPATLEFKANLPPNRRLNGLETRLKTPILDYFERQVMRNCRSIHVLSQFTRVHLDVLHGVGDKINIIPHWCRTEDHPTLSKREARECLGWPQEAKIFFTLRAQVWRNGIDLALDAIAPLAKAGKCRFYVAGGGGLRAFHERYAQELGLGDSVSFLGRISDEQLALAYQAADLFLLPTRSLECFGLIIQEAFSFGCPILASNAGAIPELLQPISPQFLVPAGNAMALRQKMEAFLSGALLPPSAQELRDYVEQRYRAEKIVPQMLHWIQNS